MATLSSILPPVSVSTASGTLPASNGGTGLTSPGTAGNILTSDGTAWASSALPASVVAYPQNVQSGNYTLVLGDAGKQIYSANTGAQAITIPTNASVAFPIGTVITVVNAGTNAILLGNTGINLYRNGNTTPLEFSSIPQRGSVQLLKTGTDNWDTIAGNLPAVTVSYAVVAGGGGQGSRGGGGGGGVLFSGIDFLRGTFTVTVGAGGASGVAGSNSVFRSNTALAGTAGSFNGGNSGGTDRTQGGIGGNGGTDTIYYTYNTGGGGGGALPANGTNGFDTGGGGGSGAMIPGSGAAGRATSISGTSITYGGGGGGASYDYQGGAGAGGGGAGGTYSIAAGSGTANTGGGAGGVYVSGTGAGGSGRVVLACRIPATSTTGSPVITTAGDLTVYTFNSSGSITF